MPDNPYYHQLKLKVVTGRSVFIAHNAVVIGDVILEEEVSVWYNAVIRGDSDSIRIGARTNIQDGCIIHVDEGVPVSIGTDNVIGHGAIIHGARIGNANLIGMRATILNHARIGNNCIIGAHALVTEHMEVPDNSLVLGTPASVIRTLTEEEMARHKKAVAVYVKLGSRYLQSLP
jgi:carbonic anhydrase/acetyltransferase-like protein (isoleucine patch superfamily)